MADEVKEPTRANSNFMRGLEPMSQAAQDEQMFINLAHKARNDPSALTLLQRIGRSFKLTDQGKRQFVETFVGPVKTDDEGREFVVLPGQNPKPIDPDSMPETIGGILGLIAGGPVGQVVGAGLGGVQSGRGFVGGLKESAGDVADVIRQTVGSVLGPLVGTAVGVGTLNPAAGVAADTLIDTGIGLAEQGVDAALAGESGLTGEERAQQILLQQAGGLGGTAVGAGAKRAAKALSPSRRVASALEGETVARTANEARLTPAEARARGLPEGGGVPASQVARETVEYLGDTGIPFDAADLLQGDTASALRAALEKTIGASGRLAKARADKLAKLAEYRGRAFDEALGRGNFASGGSIVKAHIKTVEKEAQQGFTEAMGKIQQITQGRPVIPVGNTLRRLDSMIKQAGDIFGDTKQLSVLTDLRKKLVETMSSNGLVSARSFQNAMANLRKRAKSLGSELSGLPSSDADYLLNGLRKDLKEVTELPLASARTGALPDLDAARSGKLLSEARKELALAKHFGEETNKGVLARALRLEDAGPGALAKLPVDMTKTGFNAEQVADALKKVDAINKEAGMGLRREVVERMFENADPRRFLSLIENAEIGRKLEVIFDGNPAGKQLFDKVKKSYEIVAGGSKAGFQQAGDILGRASQLSAPDQLLVRIVASLSPERLAVALISPNSVARLTGLLRETTSSTLIPQAMTKLGVILERDRRFSDGVFTREQQEQKQ